MSITIHYATDEWLESYTSSYFIADWYNLPAICGAVWIDHSTTVNYFIHEDMCSNDIVDLTRMGKLCDVCTLLLFSENKSWPRVG